MSILKRAREKKLLDIRNHNIRDFAEDKWGRVDDRPFGGGPGMVMMVGPCVRAIRNVRREGSHVIHLSPQGKKLTAAKARALAAHTHLILLCGHYEGIDERVIEAEVDEEISIGDYVLTNGCAAAIVLVDALCRFLPGVLGHDEAANADSFEEGIFEGPQYTRPIEFENRVVPPILRGGNHQEIKKWRHGQALRKTESVRPELLKK
ncbi:MAG: tRNA (guanine-N(1)-)-methyltransferase [Chlamydiae bacterium]|nr:tRNA (guanine-N(1)-)-methyltransferase [Chlamydiota bacterium]